MKKIGILTFHRGFNYGATLQAYALSSTLKQFGFQVEVIDFVSYANKAAYAHFLVPPTSIGAIKRNTLSLLTANYQRRRKICYKYFINRYIPLSSKRNITQEFLPPVCESYDAVICGSDQVWNPRLVDSVEAFFLPYGRGFRKIAYAVSLGNGSLEEFSNQKLLKESIEKFDYVSVREKSSLKKIQSYYSGKIEMAIDPTLLLKREDFLNIASNDKHTNKYIFLYSVTSRPQTIQAAKDLSKRLGIPVIALFPGHPRISWIANRKMIPSGGGGPQEFLAYIRDAEYVVTDSFHGSVFSLVFRKKFFIIQKEDNNKEILPDERINTLCSVFHIENRLIRAKTINTTPLDCDIDWDKIESIRQEYAENSKTFLRNALSDIGAQSSEISNSADSICQKDLCTGCMACLNRCKLQAITPVLEKDGRILPHIDLSKCVQCDACRKVCPQINRPALHSVSVCYAAQSKKDGRIHSSSGGIGWELMNHVFSQGGCIFGSVIEKDLTVKHICAKTPEDIERMRTSKYVISSMLDTYHAVQNKLKEQKKVLFIGTPCQVAGLKNIIGQNDNLFCVDLICHGTPPMKFLLDHIKAKTKEADYYSFRGGKKDFMFQIFHEGDIKLSRFWKIDEYFYAFMKSLSYQGNCYSCNYAKIRRIGDITIGDFWGLDRNSLKTKMKGRISVVLLNTEKGKELFDSIADNLVYEERNFEDALPKNPNLTRPSLIHPARESFICAYEKTQDFEQAFLSSGILKEWKKERFKGSLLGKIILKFNKIVLSSSK